MNRWNRKARARSAAPVLAGSRPVPVVAKKKKKRDSGDLVIGALGVALGLTCALFPWYIFFNQDKFGVQKFVFEGYRSAERPSSLAVQPSLVHQPFSPDEVPLMALDHFPTATIPDKAQQARAVPASEQPFPADLVSFRVVHIANGRAMIQDEDGLWVVQRGSRLPDASRVASIEQRHGKWVLVTTRDRVVPLER